MKIKHANHYAIGPCALACTTAVTTLFEKLNDNCHPIATKSRKYSYPDQQCIHNEVQHMLKEGIIEPSNSPWRAQGDNMFKQ